MDVYALTISLPSLGLAAGGARRAVCIPGRAATENTSRLLLRGGGGGRVLRLEVVHELNKLLNILERARVVDRGTQTADAAVTLELGQACLFSLQGRRGSGAGSSSHSEQEANRTEWEPLGTTVGKSRVLYLAE